MAKGPPLPDGCDIIMVMMILAIAGGGIWWAVDLVRRALTSS